MERMLFGGDQASYASPSGGPRIRKYVYYALVLLLVSITIHRERFGIPFELDAPALLLLAALTFLASPASVLRFKAYPLLVPMAGFVLAGYASCLDNNTALSAATRDGVTLLNVCLRQSAVLTYRVIMFYVVVLAAGLLPESRRRPAIVLLGVLLVQTAVSLIVLPFFPSPVSQLLIRGDQFGVGSRALMGFFLEPNLFGIYAVAVVGLWLSIALYMTDKRSQTYVLACVLIGSVAVFMSYTRSAWLALLLIFLILGVGVFIRPRLGGVRARRVIIALAVVIAVGYALSLLVSLLSQGESVWTLLQRGMNLVQAGSGSGEGRLRVWQTALRHWLRRPWLGWGLLSLERSNLPTSQGWLYSSVIQTLHDTGVFGLFFMLWVCVGVAWQTLKGFLGARAEIDKGMALGYLVAQGALFFTSQFSSYFWGGLTWVLLGMSVAHARLIGATTEDAEVEPAGEPRRTKSRSRGGVSP